MENKLNQTKNNFKKVQLILVVLLFANLGVAIAKIIIGKLIHSSAIFADGIHSLSDASSNVVGIVGIVIASKPVDDNHPYGHKKFETLAGLAISFILFFIGLNIIINGVKKLIDPVEINLSRAAFVIMLATLVINIVVTSFEYYQGKKLNSYILIADSMHTRSDIFVTLGVLASLFAIKMGLPPQIDPVVSILVALAILKAAYQIFEDTNGILMDRAIVEPKVIEDIVMSFEHVEGVHKIRSRGSKNDMHVDMHIQLNQNMTILESHKLVHAIGDKVREEINPDCQVIIHTEPFH